MPIAAGTFCERIFANRPFVGCDVDLCRIVNYIGRLLRLDLADLPETGAANVL